MKRCLVAFTAIVVCTPLSAQQPAQPTEAHKIFADDAGTWDVDVKMYFQGPGGPASESTGVETTELVSGGLYARSSYHGKMREEDFEGHGLMGYDPRTEEYVLTWADNFTAVPTQFKGKFDAEKRTLTMFASVVDVGTGEEMQVKHVTTFVDATTKTFASFLIVDAGGQKVEVKLMETTAKKRT